MTISIFEMFGLLVGAHLLADYPLQGDFLAKAKNPTAPIPGVPWQQAMFAHAGIHGLLVGLVTGSLWLGLLEAAFHAYIDYGKCRGWISFNVDQACHLVCKAAWCVAVLLMQS